MADKLVFQTEIKPVAAAQKGVILAGVPKSKLPYRLADELARVVDSPFLVYAETVSGLREMAGYRRPEVMVIDERILGRAPLAQILSELAASAPIVLVAGYERQMEVEGLIARGEVEFVPRADQWELLAARLVERRLRWAEHCGIHLPVPSHAFGEDLGEIFRHEINNPLTGILGNAELLLAHSDRFSPAETQRIRTVVDLAVRLRETVRRVSNLWEKGLASKSA